MTEQQGELDAEVAGQKFKYVGPLNTLACVATAAGVAVIIYMNFAHATDTKEAAHALVEALHEQTQALRENNCLQSYRGPDDQRASFCRQVAR